VSQKCTPTEMAVEAFHTGSVCCYSVYRTIVTACVYTLQGDH